MNFFELRQATTNMGDSVEEAKNKLAALANDPKASIEDIKAQQKASEALELRYNELKKQYDEAVKAQEAQTKEAPKQLDPKERKAVAMASLVRSVMNNEPVSADVRQALGDNDTTGGNKFLPKTVSTDIITGPEEHNPLRDVSVISQIPNLEIPRLTTQLDDDDFIEDLETAKEMEAKGDTVAFSRNKFKVKVGLSETVLLGSDADLASYIQRELQNGVIRKERKVAFNPAPAKQAEKHMSFYDPTVAIKTINGSTTYEAVTAALADLHEDYRENATVVMSYKDYVGMIKDLANGSTELYSAQPEQIFGKPVVFTDAAVKPIVGDFNYSQYNYDINTIYDHDKDVNTGVELFVLTAWFDHQIKLSSAFRIAEVSTASK